MHALFGFRNVENEIEDIEKTFAAAKSGDPNYTRRISFSLLQKKQSKVLFCFPKTLLVCRTFYQRTQLYLVFR